MKNYEISAITNFITYRLSHVWQIRLYTYQKSINVDIKDSNDLIKKTQNLLNVQNGQTIHFFSINNSVRVPVDRNTIIQKTAGFWHIHRIQMHT
jgi:hypothetical protein